MGIAARIFRVTRAFLVGLTIGSGVIFFVLTAAAATGVITPDGEGSQNDAVQQGSCEDALDNSTCIDGYTSTSSSPSGTFLRAVNGNADFFTMTTLGDVATATLIRIPVYHIEGSSNMRLDVSLWNLSESTQYGTTFNLPVVTGAADWSVATFTVNMAGSPDLDELRVRIGCTRPGTGKATQCDYYGMFGQVVYIQQVDVLVGTTSAQQNLDVGTTSAHVGGSFVISEVGGGSRNVSSVTITENGSVDAANDLTNIRLYYETAADCSSEVFNGTEVQFGATSSAFSGADGTATFGGMSVNINSSNELCLYPVLDVNNTANAGDVIELEISNPLTQVSITGSPVISPSSAVALFSSTTLLKADLQQIRSHWRDDGGDETAASSLTSGVQDTILGNAGIGAIYRVRMEVSNEGNKTSASTQYRLEYATKVTECNQVAFGAWTDVGTGGGDWDMAGSVSGLSEGSDTSNISEGIGGVSNENNDFIGTAGQKETSSQTAGLTLTSSQYYEMEFAIEAQTGVSPGTNYCFRVTDAGSTTTINYIRFPEATIAADLTVSATSTPPVTVSIPTNDIYGGGFVITDATAGSHTINSFTITASGTIDLQNHVEDITLRYESDTTVPLDCTGETYAGTETIYGTVDTDGFSLNGTSTFTEGSPPSVENGVNALCFYIEYNITASTTNGEKIEFRITDASTDVVADSGSVSPAALVDIDGDTTFVAPIVKQEAYHWRDNLGTEATAGSLTSGSQNTPLGEVPKNSTVRLRLGISNTGGETSGNYQYQLEWAQKVTSCGAVEIWTDIDTVSDDWSVVGSQLQDDVTTIDISNSIGGVTNVGTFLGSNGGQQDVDGLTGNIDLPAQQFVELEYSIVAAASVTEGTQYCFRVSNNGTKLDGYTNYAEATIKLATDFKIQRGTTTIQAGTTTAIIRIGDNYDQPASASTSFIRIINSGYTGRGPDVGTTGNLIASDVTTYIVNPNSITSNIAFRRAGTTGSTVIKWEIIEYTGAPGGENEISVRDAGFVTFGTTNLAATTTTISPIASSSKVLPYITAQGNPDTSRFDYNTGLTTSYWNAGANTATFTRGEHGNDAINVSYAIVEFKGSNWNVQRAQMTYNVKGTATTTKMRAVNDTTKAFIHGQHRAGSNQDLHGDFGHEIWISGMGQLSFFLNSAAQTAALHTSVAWVVENRQQLGDVMKVTDVTGNVPASGGGLTSTNVPLGFTIDDLSVTSLNFLSTNNGTARSFPEPILGAQLISDSAINVEVTDDDDVNLYRAQIVEWPTAARKLIQDDFQFFVDNDTLIPDDPWPVGVNDLGENEPMTATDGPIGVGDSIRIRMNMHVTAASMPAGVDAFQFEYAENPGTCTAATEWFLLGNTSSTTALWRGHAGTQSDGDPVPTLILGASTVEGTYEEESPTALTPNVAVVGDYVEFDWSIEPNGATEKTQYCFRMVESDRSPLEDYLTYPIILTAGYGPVIGNWQWFDDATSTTPQSPFTGENSAPSEISNDNEIKLRLTMAEKAGATGPNVKFALQYSDYADFSIVHNVTSSSTCQENSTWCYADGAANDNEIIDASVLSDSDSCSGGSGSGCGIHNEGTTTASTFDHTANTNAEFEFTIQNAGARANTVYYFRLYDLVNDEVIVASSSYPSLQVEGAKLTFTIAGLPSGITTEAIITDVTTSATAVNFGSIPLSTEYEAAQRITVDTNATEGYQVLMYSTQDLLNSYQTPIDPVLTTNASPGEWSTAACLPPANGCFGYHAGDDSLGSGSSVRFASDDTYAALEETPREIMYSSVPIVDVNDIIFKVEVGSLQEAGDYSTDLVYLVIPTF